MTYNILAQVNPRHLKYCLRAFPDSSNISPWFNFLSVSVFLSLPHPGAHRHLECLSGEGQAHRTGSQYCARHQL